ncbi:uncharacterized protein UBRO2_05819 [Ustilago bromivora]|uniref:Uncharacterized protein n=1 Tax=Ustilago bromivora TaxID=307758 RepID=A0A8H8TV38_9BASI|nr:uncharacterized protein UBRO2_05819 [Ustilago bromivora]
MTLTSMPASAPSWSINWTEKDLDAWQEELGGAPRWTTPSSAITKTTPAPSQLSSGPKGPHAATGGEQTQARYSSSNELSSSPQQTQAWPHLYNPSSSSLQQTQAQHSTSFTHHLSPQLAQALPPTSTCEALAVPSADQCLTLLLASRLHNPPNQPNTSLTHNILDPTTSPARFGSMQVQLHAWQALLRGYPDPHFTHQGDLEDAFCHVVTADVDAPLLGFHYNGVQYWENALTFGGSSSPFLFNFVAEALHWVVASCLPTAWPLNHYLNDTFGTVPAEACDLSLLPVCILALAAAALGLRLSTKKTFAGLTRLEILSIEFDSIAQTVGITAERRATILSQCQMLIQCSTVDLLDMQHISGLLHFVSQVFPCGKAFLHHLQLFSQQVPGTQPPSPMPPRAGGSITTFCTFCALRFGPNTPCLPASGLQLLEWLSSILGADADTIQCLGRWNSDCFQRYIDRSAMDHQDLSITALYHLWDGLLIPHTTSWHDMGSS